MASASDPPAHPALQPADQLILPPQQPPAAVETSIGPPHCPAEGTQSDAFVQPTLRARQGHANSDSFPSRDRRRSPAATPQSSQIAPRQRPDQPIEWHQRATLPPILPCNLPTGSSYRLNTHPPR